MNTPKPIKGQPRKFFDLKTGAVFNISEEHPSNFLAVIPFYRGHGYLDDNPYVRRLIKNIISTANGAKLCGRNDWYWTNIGFGAFSDSRCRAYIAASPPEGMAGRLALEYYGKGSTGAFVGLLRLISFVYNPRKTLEPEGRLVLCRRNEEERLSRIGDYRPEDFKNHNIESFIRTYIVPRYGCGEYCLETINSYGTLRGVGSIFVHREEYQSIKSSAGKEGK